MPIILNRAVSKSDNDTVKNAGERYYEWLDVHAVWNSVCASRGLWHYTAKDVDQVIERRYLFRSGSSV